MKIYRTLLVLLVACLVPCLGLRAVDDFDLESLLGDLDAGTSGQADEPDRSQSPEVDDLLGDFSEEASDEDLLDAELFLLENGVTTTGDVATAPAADDFEDPLDFDFGLDFDDEPPPPPEPVRAPAPVAAAPAPVDDFDDFDLDDDYGLGDLDLSPAPVAPATQPPVIPVADQPAPVDDPLDFGFEFDEDEFEDDTFGVLEVEPVQTVTPPAPVMPPRDPVAAAPSAPTPAEPVQALTKEEEVRRQALEVEGMNSLQMAFEAFDRGDYEESLPFFQVAMEKIPDRPARRQDIQRARWGHADADYQIAYNAFRAREPDLAKAEKHINSALAYMPDNRAALSLKSRIERALEREAIRLAQPIPAEKTPAVMERQKSSDDLMREARDYYGIGDYNKAESLFEQVLMIDEYNTTAMRYLRRIAEKKAQIGTTAREATRARAIAKVTETWTPPIRDVVEPPSEVTDRTGTKKMTAAEQLRQRMEQIVIPRIEFRDANIQDVIDFLSEASEAAAGEGGGVNIVLHMPKRQGTATTRAQPAPRGQPADPFADDFDDLWGEPSGMQLDAPAERSIMLTLNLRRISLLDAVKTITEITGMRYRIDDNMVVISPQGMVQGQVITRLYPVQPTILDVVIQRDDTEADRGGDFIGMGQQSQVTRSDVKDFFIRTGVPFPEGTSITYNPTISQLIVANTAENLETFERILAQLNVIPNQVEIEARFIEISENDLREIGLEWILRNNWEVATRKGGSGPLSAQERIQIDSSSGFTDGLRFFNYSTEHASIDPLSAITKGTERALGGILSISSILTNPELSVVLHALDQSGGTDLLSAPRVTARSGFNATIGVVREIIYPTEYDAQSQRVGTGQAETTDQTVVVVTPQSFQTREVGVILNVTPTVGPDGYTIDLAMVPEVSELIGWLDYGSSLGTTRYRMPQPIFSSRNVTTSIVIWDGQTVVMGGLIREELTTFKDKVPLLGDIPLLGRLFRSEGQRSQKKNLLIFVTARLVDPAGRPINVKREGLGPALPAEADPI